MKFYLSVDMEGIADVSAREQVTLGHAEYARAEAQMTAEVAAALEGAFAAGADEVWVKDAHWTGRNFTAEKLRAPEGKILRLVRGWSGHPFSMVQGLDESFTAVGFLGYHSAAGQDGNPLSHTLSSRLLAEVTLNGEPASEFLLFGLAAALEMVPVAFLSGDQALCEEARRRVETLETVATFQGQGASIVALPPDESRRLIRDGVERALSERRGRVLPLPDECTAVCTFHSPAEAYRKQFYPGARLGRDNEVVYETRDYFEVLRWLGFMTR